MLGDAIDIRAPFDVAFIFFLLAGLYARFAIPYIPNESVSDPKLQDQSGVAGFLAPLKILVPQRLRMTDGSLKKHYGVVFLCSGIFLGVVSRSPQQTSTYMKLIVLQLATGYAPSLIQMYATAAFDFDQASNGWLMAEFAFVRSFFLIFLFPRIIAFGRDRISSARHTTSESPNQRENFQQGLPIAPGLFDAPSGEQTEEEPLIPSQKRKDHGSCVFDLVFLRWSLVVDGALTTVAAFATRPWHIYLGEYFVSGKIISEN